MGFNSLWNKINSLNEQANKMFRRKKKDTLVLVAPFDNEKGWIIDVCHDYKTGKENTTLRKRLNQCSTFEELERTLDGYATNVPNVRRSDEYEV